jgi:very-short-patch-repair endonuclease
MVIKYNPKLTEFARQLRNNATKSEIKVWQCLKRSQLFGYDFHRQKPIDEYIADFFCNTLQLVIECDGYSHEIQEVWNKDVKKTNRFNELDIRVLRFSDHQIMNDFENVYRAIEDYIIKFEENGLPPIEDYS